MANEKQKSETFRTPKGVAVYPYLLEPDTKFDKDGVFRVGLRLKGEDAAKLKKQIDDIRRTTYLEHQKEANEKAKGKKVKLKAADAPYKEVADDKDKPTGEVEFRFKQKAKVTGKNGKQYDFHVSMFDAKGAGLPKGTNVYGGTEMKVAFEFNPFNSPTIGSGVGLRLRAVQIIKLVQGGEDSAERYGFSAEEGYVGGGEEGEEGFPESDDGSASAEPSGESEAGAVAEDDIPF